MLKEAKVSFFFFFVVVVCDRMVIALALVYYEMCYLLCYFANISASRGNSNNT